MAGGAHVMNKNMICNGNRLPCLMFVCRIAGGVRARLHGRLHGGDVHEDPLDGVHPPQEQLHAQHVEHHGLLRRHLRVRRGRRVIQPAAKQLGVGALLECICM